MTRIVLRLLFPVLIFLLLAGCDSTPETATPLVPAEGTPPSEAAPTLTPFPPPTAAPEVPLAATVNGEPITLEAYQAELSRAQSVSGTGLMTYSEADVLQNLIDETLLAQGAAEAGFIPDDALIQERIAQLGDAQTLEAWLTANGYTRQTFEQALRRAVAAAWMRDQIIAAVPSTAEQVHARQILLYNADEAENVYAQLQSGSDFATLAAQYDPQTLGDLGWFPRGYLTVPELDEPVFALQPGEYTPVIQTALGFHIVQVIERDPQRPLSPGALQSMQVQALQDWLDARRAQSDIQILTP